MRLYIAQFSAIAITAAQDLFEIVAPADGAIYIHEWEVFQTTDVGDIAEEILRIETVRGVGSVTSGSGGSTVTPSPVSSGDIEFTGTVERNNTTRMVQGSGTLLTLEQRGWNVRAPLRVVYSPECRPIIGPSHRWTLSLPAAPTDSLTTSAQVLFECYGMVEP